MTPSDGLSRRIFLARIGVLGAAVSSAPVLRALPAASAPDQVLDPLVGLLRPLLQELSRDTFNGLTTFVVPGPDAYSLAQGTPRLEPGALEAKATDFTMEALDNFVPFPQDVAQTVSQALITAVSDLGIDLPLKLGGILPIQLVALDDALRAVLQADGALPLSLVVALLLNLVATQVNPLAVSGLFLSPFARLRYPEKAEAFRLIEGPDADLVAALDTQLPEPLRSSLSGLLRFVGGALLEFPVFGSYGEFGVFDPATKTLRARPVGWTLTGYPRVSDGWDDFLGYYQGRTEVRD